MICLVQVNFNVQFYREGDISRDSTLCHVCHVICLFVGRLTGTQELDRNSRGIGQSPQEINFINEVSIKTRTSIF